MWTDLGSSIQIRFMSSCHPLGGLLSADQPISSPHDAVSDPSETHFLDVKVAEYAGEQ